MVEPFVVTPPQVSASKQRTRDLQPLGLHAMGDHKTVRRWTTGRCYPNERLTGPTGPRRRGAAGTITYATRPVWRISIGNGSTRHNRHGAAQHGSAKTAKSHLHFGLFTVLQPYGVCSPPHSATIPSQALLVSERMLPTQLRSRQVTFPG
jgi:hypothetical protein